MLKHFTGTHDHKLDGKGRVSLPTAFRRVLTDLDCPDHVVICPQLDHENAHVCFSMLSYENMLDRHNQTEYDSFEQQLAQEIRLISRAIHVPVDDAGRIVLNQQLREQIRLDKELRFVGASSTFELWRPDVREAVETSALAGAQPFRLDRRGLH